MVESVFQELPREVTMWGRKQVSDLLEEMVCIRVEELQRFVWIREPLFSYSGKSLCHAWGFYSDMC